MCKLIEIQTEKQPKLLTENRKSNKVSRKPTRFRDDFHVNLNKLRNFSISSDSDGYMYHEARLRKN